MKLHSPLFLLAAMGVLTHAGPAWSAPDPSQWKCAACPYPKGASGSVEAGVIAVSDDAPRFGDFTGLDKKGAYLLLDGNASYRGEAGYYADATAENLGLDTRSLRARSGHEGLYDLRIGYAELPRHLTQGAASPFIGIGGNTLTLPAGYPAAGTSTMPLGSTLQPVDIGYKRKRLGLAATVIAVDNWTYKFSVSHDVRDGTQPTSGAFFAAAAQMVAPVSQVTDQIEVSAAYTTRVFQASLAYGVSRFHNNDESLTWSNPFWPVVPGATRGQLALAPDNDLQQVVASAGLQVAPSVRISGDAAFGRLTQNASFLPSTLNTSLTGVPALPSPSLSGLVETFNGNVKLSAAPLPDLRVNASYARDVRDNNTGVQAYRQVATDTFVDSTSRKNTPFSLTQDRFKLQADYRGIEAVKLTGGAEQDNQHRNYSEAEQTRETTVWARGGMQPLENLGLSLKWAHAERRHPVYGTVIWFGAPENPLLRKYNMADRSRDTIGLRSDLAVSETFQLGLSLDHANDEYGGSAVGLQHARSVNLALDMAASFSERTQLTAYVQTERILSRQTGSQSVGPADWTARNNDRFNLAGLNVKHALIVDKLDVSADLSVSRSSSQVTVATGVDAPAFPAATTSLDSLKLQASYKVRPTLWLNASVWHQRYASQDWHLDGVLPGTVQNLLALGQVPPQYSVNVLRLSLRQAF